MERSLKITALCLTKTCRAVVPMIGLVVFVLLICILFPGVVLESPKLAGV